jgi:predicted acylesterase/phospholipase RssA
MMAIRFMHPDANYEDRARGATTLWGILNPAQCPRPYNPRMSRKLIVLGIVLVFLVLAVWALEPLALRPIARLDPVPVDKTMQAVIPGIPDARYWVALDIQPMIRDMLAAREREQAFRTKNGGSGELPPMDLLAVSGGGDNGAFGAGLLCGWTATGKRPEFKAVTGVSTGALIAPFAFLGPDYDKVLKIVYTSVTPHDIATHRWMAAAVTNDGMADNRPLWELISKYIDQDLMDRIAAEYAKGRILLIGTTNLDARQPVIWNMGSIATSKTPQALTLFRSILLASAAIPGAFPPSMVRVEVDGKPYEEMHVDGGASAQVFLYPPSMRSAAQGMGVAMSREGRVYVIRNSSLTATWAPVERRTINIAARAIDSLIQTQGLGDLYRIYLTTQRDGLDFNLAIIGPDFQYVGKKEEFETPFMMKLFDYGFKMAQQPDFWRKAPPGLEAPISAGHPAAETVQRGVESGPRAGQR